MPIHHFRSVCLFMGLLSSTPALAQADIARVDSLNEKAWSFYNKQPDSVIAYGNQALARSEITNYPTGKAAALVRLARGYTDKGQHESARSYCMLAIEAAKHARVPRYEAGAYLNLSYLDLCKNRFSDAFEYAQKALAIAESSNDKRNITMAHMRIGQVYSQTNDFTKAANSLKTGLRIAVAENDLESMGYLCSELATVYKNQAIDTRSNDFSEAIRYFDRAANILSELGISEAWVTRLTLSNLYAETLSDTARALQEVQKAYAIVQQTGDRYGQCRVLTTFAARLNESGKTTEATKALQMAEALARQEQFSDLLLLIYHQRTLANIRSGRPDSAQHYLQAYGFALKDRLQQTSELEKKLIAVEKDNQLLALQNEKNRQGIQLQLQRSTLLRQRLLTTEKEAAIASLEQARKIQGLEMEQKEAERRLESERQAAELSAADARTRALRNRLFALLGGAVAAIALLWQYLRIRRIRREQRIRLEFSRKMAELETRTLRAQMNPHFIFNALTSIKKFILTNDTDNAESYLSRFARLIRLILENSRQTTATLKSEIELLDNYIQLERLRSGERFDYSIVLGDDVSPDDIEIPSLVLQPYVENAIVHGLNNRPEPGGHLCLKFFRDQGTLYVQINDNGVGREKSQALKSADQRIHHRSHGLDITRQRLDAFAERFNRPPTVAISDLTDDHGHAAGTQVVLEIPVGDDD